MPSRRWLYALLTGGNTHDFVLEQEDMWRQLVNEPSLAFERHGVTDLPAVEQAIQRALSKDPAGRYGSMRELATALESAVHADRRDARGRPVGRPRDARQQPNRR